MTISSVHSRVMSTDLKKWSPIFTSFSLFHVSCLLWPLVRLPLHIFSNLRSTGVASYFMVSSTMGSSLDDLNLMVLLAIEWSRKKAQGEPTASLSMRVHFFCIYLKATVAFFVSAYVRSVRQFRTVNKSKNSLFFDYSFRFYWVAIRNSNASIFVSEKRNPKYLMIF